MDSLWNNAWWIGGLLFAIFYVALKLLTSDITAEQIERESKGRIKIKRGTKLHLESFNEVKLSDGHK